MELSSPEQRAYYTDIDFGLRFLQGVHEKAEALQGGEALESVEASFSWPIEEVARTDVLIGLQISTPFVFQV